MKRTSVNPTEWGLGYEMDQAELVEGATRFLHCSGQVALEEDAGAESGFRVTHAGDLRGQMEDALANIDALLEKAGMDRRNILTLRFYTTDIDGVLENYDVYTDWIAPAGIRPPQSLLGVERLVLPELLIEIEALAAA